MERRSVVLSSSQLWPQDYCTRVCPYPAMTTCRALEICTFKDVTMIQAKMNQICCSQTLPNNQCTFYVCAWHKKEELCHHTSVFVFRLWFLSSTTQLIKYLDETLFYLQIRKEVMKQTCSKIRNLPVYMREIPS